MQPYSKEQLFALYSNPALKENERFIEILVKDEMNQPDHDFHLLVSNYFQAWSNVQSHLYTLSMLENRYHELMWKFETQVIKEESICKHGRKKEVCWCSNKDVCDDALCKLIEETSETKHSLEESLNQLKHGETLARLKMEDYVLKQINGFLLELPPRAPVKGYLPGELSQEQMEILRSIKTCISILFSFKQRNSDQGSSDQSIKDVNQCLNLMVSVLLRTASLEDHHFLANHVFRCPAGFSSWALPFVQSPPPLSHWPFHLDDITVFGSPYVDKALVYLSTLLLPIRARNEFLDAIKAAWKAKCPNDQNPEMKMWTALEPDGRMRKDVFNTWLSPRKENVLIGLFNQVDFAAIFRQLLLISNAEEADQYDCSRMSQRGLFKLLSFATHLVELLHAGLANFSSLNFSDLSKRLSLLIGHVVLFVLDQWQNFKDYGSNQPRNPHLQLEVDHFFSRSILSLFISPNTFPWQLVAELPYQAISYQRLWWILWLFYHQDFSLSLSENLDSKPLVYANVDYSSKVRVSVRKVIFKEQLYQMPKKEAIFLLQTLATMAKCRDWEDSDFINFVTTELFKIAFLNDKLKKVFSKEGSVLLSHITERHPIIISVLLSQVKENEAKLEQMALHIFEHIPLFHWTPSTEDLKLIHNWLLETPISSIYNQLARFLLTRLHWDFKGGNLALDISTHRKVALLVVQACHKLTVNRSSKQDLLSWGWDLLFHLRLHTLDLAAAEEGPQQLALAQAMLSNTTLPALDSYPDQHPLLMALEDHDPVASYVALVMTGIGHNIDTISQVGFGYILNILEKCQYLAVIHALYRIVPFFFSNPEPLLENQQFAQILEGLLKADSTFWKRAKNLVSPKHPGEVLYKFCSMIYKHESFGGATAICFWVKAFATLYWRLRNNHLTQEVNYILDNLVQMSILHHSLLPEIIALLTECVKVPPTQSPSSSSHTHFSNLSNDNEYLMVPASLDAFSSITSTYSSWWFYWLGTLVECRHPYHREWWSQLLTELTFDPDQSASLLFKRLVATTKRDNASMSHLPVVRWTNHCLMVPLDHPAMPLVWQNFFLYFSHKIQKGAKSVATNFLKESLMKKLKKRLTELCKHHLKLIEKYRIEIETTKPEKKEDYPQNKDQLIAMLAFQERLYNFYKMLSAWIMKPKLLSGTVVFDSLPEMFDTGLVEGIFAQEMEPWLEFVNMEGLHSDKQAFIEHWNSNKMEVPQKKASALKTYALVTGATLAGAVALPMATVPLLGAVGFTAGGVAAGSAAAAIQSAVYGGATTGLFSLCQSIGVVGLGATGTAVTSAVGGATSFLGAKAVALFRKKD